MFIRACIILSLLIPCICQGQAFKYRFERFSTRDGLLHNNIDDVDQDQHGNIWVSTEGGLNKYDGHRFTAIKHQPGDSTSLPFSRMRALNKLADQRFLIFKEENEPIIFDPVANSFEYAPFERTKCISFLHASDHSYWIGTKKKGLIKVNAQFDTMAYYGASNDALFRIPSNEVRFLAEDSKGRVWVNTSKGGLSVIDPNTAMAISLPYQKEENGVLNDGATILNAQSVYDMLELRPDRYIFATSLGLALYNDKDQSFKHYTFTPFDVNNRQKTVINCLKKVENKIWCGTNSSGIWIFDLGSHTFTQHYEFDRNDPHGLPANSIQGFYYSEQFEDGVLWIITPKGLGKVNLYQNKFDLLYHIPGKPETEGFEQVRSLFADGNKLWIGSDSETQGLTILDMGNRTTRRLSYNEDQSNRLGAGRIGSISKSKNGEFWIPTWSGYLNKYQPKTGKIDKWLGYHNDFGMNAWVLTSTHVDKTEDIWISTIQDGVFRIDPRMHRLLQFTPENTDGQLPHRTVRGIYSFEQDGGDLIWFATDGGLSRFDLASNTFKAFLTHDDLNDLLTCNSLYHIYRENSRIFWLGTENCGLVRFDIMTNTIEVYTTKDGLPSNAIKSIYPDKNGNLWMSTNFGISKMDIINRKFVNYEDKDGLQDNHFIWGAHAQDDSGRIYFGGPFGITHFDPADLRPNPFMARAFLSHLYIKNRPVKIGQSIQGQIVLKKALNDLEGIELRHPNHEFSISFGASHYANPLKNKFKYMLEGYDKKWILDENKSFRASYANLPAGSYTFKVLASNNDGVWGPKPAQIKIDITPPWWLTNWFRVGLVVVLVLGALFIHYWRTYQFKRNEKKLERLVQRRTHQIEIQKHELELKAQEMVIKNDLITEQAEELRTYNDALNSLNEKLESKVEDRTKALVEQNTILKEYAFINSHELRKPVSNILGIVDLFEFELKKEDNAMLVDKLKLVAQNLDNKVKEIQRKLQHDELINDK